MTAPATSVRLSKSRFTAGCQCQKLLWYRVHESGAPELQPDKVLQDRFDQGTFVGEIARTRFPGGVLIDLPHNDPARVAATAAALANGAPAIYEATFVEDGVYCAVDILQRDGAGWNLIEVKSASSLKEAHIPDAAIQAWVLRRAGLDVRRVEIMRLNGEFRHPDAGDLFARDDVTAAVQLMQPLVPELLARMRETLAGDNPPVGVGAHCFEPYECSFHGRCWPDDRDHIANLYNNGPKRTIGYMDRGVHRIQDIPAGDKLPDAAKRQLRAIREDTLIVEPTLKRALEEFGGERLGFLDFETINRAVPVWDGLGPWRAAVVQFSYHEDKGNGEYSHVGWLAEGPHDPREELARLMLEATRGAERIVMYSSYERTRIKELAESLPQYAEELTALAAKLIDLLPVVRNNVYHTDFRGSFSLKAILEPLVPALTYKDLAIVDGQLASVEIARLLFVAHKIPPAERDQLRIDLLAYCQQDTWAMVKLLERLRELA